MTYLGTSPAVVELAMTRGDEVSITFTHNLSTTSFDDARFYVRTHVDGEIVLALTKVLHASQWTFPTSSTAVLAINGSDTDGSLPGRHVYDVEFQPSSGTSPVTTQRGTFILNGDISTIFGSGTVSDPSLAAAVAVLQDEMDAVEADVATLQSEMDAVEADVATLQGEMDAVEADVATLQSDVIALQGGVAVSFLDVTAALTLADSHARKVLVTDGTFNLTLPTTVTAGTEIRVFNAAFGEIFFIPGSGAEIIGIEGSVEGVGAMVLLLKKSATVWLLAVLTTAAAVNLIENRGFETVGSGGAADADVWVEVTGDNTPQRTSISANTGSYAMRIESTWDGIDLYDSGYVYQDITVEERVDYDFTFYARRYNGGLSSGATMNYRITNTAETTTYASGQVSPPAGGAWTRYDDTVSIPAGVTTVRIAFDTETAPSGHGVIIDDVFLVLSE